METSERRADRLPSLGRLFERHPKPKVEVWARASAIPAELRQVNQPRITARARCDQITARLTLE